MNQYWREWFVGQCAIILALDKQACTLFRESIKPGQHPGTYMYYGYPAVVAGVCQAINRKLQKTGKEPFWAHALAKIAHKAAMESLEEAYRAVLNGKPTQKHHTIL
jgi:hypothetical protein